MNRNINVHLLIFVNFFVNGIFCPIDQPNTELASGSDFLILGQIEKSRIQNLKIPGIRIGISKPLKTPKKYRVRNPKFQDPGGSECKNPECKTPKFRDLGGSEFKNPEKSRQNPGKIPNGKSLKSRGSGFIFQDIPKSRSGAPQT